MSNSTIFYAVCVFLIMVSCTEKPIIDVLASPDGKLFVELDTQNKNIFYTVFKKQSDGTIVELVKTSPLGLERADQSFSQNLVLEKAGREIEIDEQYQRITGKTTQLHARAIEKTYLFNNEHGSKLEIILRVFNEGLAFRYHFPEQNSDTFTIVQEKTGFLIPTNGKAWIHPYDKITKHSPAYETYYENGIEIGSSSPGKEGWAFPALFHTQNHWLLVTESNLDTNYCGVHLNPDAENGLYTVRFPESEEVEGMYSSEPKSTLPRLMPWRVIMVGSNAGEILENNLVSHLAEPQIAGDFSWVRPGTSSWSWWSEHESSKNLQSLKKFVDLANEMGWRYSLVDANWNTMPDQDMTELVKYAHEKKVGLWLWYNSGGDHNLVEEEPRDIMNDPVARKEAFQKIKNWGVKGVKVDFFQSDKQDIIQLYHDILQDAAEHQIMVNFHGCSLPRGWERTYPNLVTSEAVMGAECYAFNKDFPENAVWHNTIMPFTRNVVGSMDYTPVAFSDQKYPHKTSYAHELALSVVFESGVIHMADKPEAYLNLPKQVIGFLSSVPSTWDETKYMAGTPGEYVVMARRKGNVWYLAGINGTDTEVKINLNANFLSELTEMQLIGDGADRQSFHIQTTDWNPENTEVIMKAAGGFVARVW
ncbi:MAG: glycoside hydrolase family 97 catalytic domain-containing protein [Cyclobacteriaceae bacterium]